MRQSFPHASMGPPLGDTTSTALQGKSSEWSSDQPPHEWIGDYAAQQFFANAYYDFRNASGRCCMNTRCGWGGVARTSRDPPQEPHYGDEVEGSSQV